MKGGGTGEERVSASCSSELGLCGEGRKLGAQGGELMKAAGIWGPLKNKFVILHTTHV